MMRYRKLIGWSLFALGVMIGWLIAEVAFGQNCPGGNCPTSVVQQWQWVQQPTLPAPPKTTTVTAEVSAIVPPMPSVKASPLTDSITKGLQMVDQCDKAIASNSALVEADRAEIAAAQARLEKHQAELTKARAVRASWLAQVMADIQAALKEK